MSAPRKICVVKLGAIGDVVNALPLVNRLRAGIPEAKISWVIAPLAHALVDGHPAVDEFLLLDIKRRASWPAFLRHLRAQKFDLVLDLQRILKSGIITRLSGAPRRLGFDRARCKELSWWFTNERIANNPKPGVTVAQYLEFGDALGLPAVDPSWDLPITPWTHAPPLVSLGIGASKPSNLWPTQRWSQLLRELATQLGAQHLALVGGPGDRELASQILSQAPTGILNTVGTLDLKQTAGLLAASSHFVACDTGPLHMAVATGTGVTALFGAADPLRTGPFAHASDVIYHPAECSPCRKRLCFVEGHPCMHNIEVDEVAQRILARVKQAGVESAS
ncbi:MAG: heptosyltransferase I [Candidatus Paceibacteria bacterium]|jgi:heptosyltransferase I